MPLSPDLWDSLVPPEVWLTIGTIGSGEHDWIDVTLRVKEPGRRSVSAKAAVSRYAPTETIVLAVSKTISALAVAQATIDRKLLEQQLHACIRTWVDPF